jgi:hypothetical protein
MGGLDSDQDAFEELIRIGSETVELLRKNTGLYFAAEMSHPQSYLNFRTNLAPTSSMQ